MPEKSQRTAHKGGPSLGLLRGAKRLAGFIFDDESQYKKVYGLKSELGLFRLNGQICGRVDTITTRIAEREASAAAGNVATA